MKLLAEHPSELSRWTRLLVGSVAILLVAFVLIPATQRLGPVREVRDAIDRAGIDASALFYTETEQSFEAEMAIRDALRYPTAPLDADGAKESGGR